MWCVRERINGITARLHAFLFLFLTDGRRD